MNEEGVRSMLPKLVKTSTGVDVHNLKCMNGSDIPLMCPLCYNTLSRNNLERMKDAMIDALQLDHLDEQQRPIYLNFIVPPVIDTARLTARLIVTRSAERTFAFPPFQLLLQRLMSVLISCDQRCKVPLTIVDDMAAADVQINVLLHFENQTEFCQAMVSDFKHKTKKRRLGEVVLDEADEDAFEVSRTDSDRLLLRYKSLDEKGINELKTALEGFVSRHASPITWTVQSLPRPIYLLGRYRKLARDVPQSCWTIGEERRGPILTFTHPLTHPLTYCLKHNLTHPLISFYTFTHTPFHTLTYTLSHPFTHPAHALFHTFPQILSHRS